MLMTSHLKPYRAGLPAPTPAAAATPSRIVWQCSAFEQLGIVPWNDIGYGAEGLGWGWGYLRVRLVGAQGLD